MEVERSYGQEYGENDQRLQVPSSLSSLFLLSIQGQLESCIFYEFEHVYCKFSLVMGSDWSLVSGLDEGITQIAKAAPPNQHIVWNFPLEMALRSSNVYGWPQIVLSVYGSDAFGHDVPRGYGRVHIPPIPGRHRLQIPLFVPESSSLSAKFTAWLTGKRPEFIHPKVIAQGEGRGVLSVRSQGHAFVELNVVLKDFTSQGYRSMSARSMSVQ